ncbi:MAG: hypothetical protein ACRC0A_05335 [Chitinophagaceae bacterium]
MMSSIKLGKDVNLSEIEAIKLYDGGTDAIQKISLSLCPSILYVFFSSKQDGY